MKKINDLSCIDLYCRIINPGDGSYPEYESGTWRISNYFGILQRIGDHTSQFRKYNTCVIHNFRNTGTGFAQYPGKAV